ncbi:MAG: hypothetical protein ACAH80_13975 [Alphaproteobacteria bacterium]
MTEQKILRFFLDSEFNEHARPYALDPISISLVPDNDAKPDYYGVSREFNATAITPWLQQNVVRHLPPEVERRSNAEIKDDMIAYLKTFADPAVTKLEIWAFNGATDQVVMANFFGGLTAMRDAFKEAGLPRPEFRDLKELTRATGERLPPPENAHDCHADALWARELYRHTAKKLSPERKFLID